MRRPRFGDDANVYNLHWESMCLDPSIRERHCVRIRKHTTPPDAQALACGSHGSVGGTASSLKTECIHRCVGVGVAREMRIARPMTDVGKICFLFSIWGFVSPGHAVWWSCLFFHRRQFSPIALTWRRCAAKSATILSAEPENLFSGFPWPLACRSLEELLLRAIAHREKSSRSRTQIRK